MTESGTTYGRPIRVTVWGENRHEKREPHVAQMYPRGMHGAIAEGIAANRGPLPSSGRRRWTTASTD